MNDQVHWTCVYDFFQSSTLNIDFNNVIGEGVKDIIWYFSRLEIVYLMNTLFIPLFVVLLGMTRYPASDRFGRLSDLI